MLQTTTTCGIEDYPDVFPPVVLHGLSLERAASWGVRWLTGPPSVGRPLSGTPTLTDAESLGSHPVAVPGGPQRPPDSARTDKASNAATKAYPTEAEERGRERRQVILS